MHPAAYRLVHSAFMAAIAVQFAASSVSAGVTAVPSVVSEPQMLVTSEACVDLDIKSLELYFANRRAETTVHRNDRGLKAYVDLRYAGSGVLEAYWEVDGRVLATVNQHLASAGEATLTSPEIPEMPTFDPGTHIVGFVVTSPAQELTVSAITYFVLPQEADALWMDLVSPREGDVLDRLQQTFSWEGTGLAENYMVRYYENPEEGPVFSAYTRETSYSLPEVLPFGEMIPGRTYYWDVVGLDVGGNIVVKSATRSFLLK